MTEKTTTDLARVFDLRDLAGSAEERETTADRTNMRLAVAGVAVGALTVALTVAILILQVA